MNNIVYYGTPDHFTGELCKGPGSGIGISQTFTAVSNRLVRVGLNIGTFKRTNKSSITISISSIDNRYSLNILTVNVKDFKDNDWAVIKCKCTLSKGTQYVLNVYTPDATPGNAITLKYGKKNHKNNAFSLDNRFELCCYFEYDVQPTVRPETKKDKGLISIVIPAYNTSKYIPKLIKSISEQEYNHYEVIVVDDYSTDSVNLLNTLLVSTMPIKYIRNSENKGASHSRNIGISQSNGEFIFCCDSDVVLQPDCLIKMIQKLHDTPDAAWVYSNFMVGDNLREFWNFSKDKMYHTNCCCSMSLVRSDVNPIFNEKLKRLQDWEMFLSLIEKGHSGVWVNETLFEAADRPGISKGGMSWEDAIKELKKLHKLVD